MYLNRMYAAKAALEPLIDANGRVVLVSADAGRWPTPGEVGPGTASAAVMMATKVLASELARWNVNVNTASVSVTEGTPAMEWIREESPAAPVFEEAVDRQEFPVAATDIAEAVLFLLGSAGARSITGQLLSVNGGVSFPG
jgi:3-oxoacyl-[acyl-carrier protein] reductase